MTADTEQLRFDRRYEKLNVPVLGQGSYGVVYKASDKLLGDLVAVKVMQTNEDEGVPATAIREVSLLKELGHVNIIKLRDVFVKRTGEFIMVLDFVDNDLKKHMKLCHDGLSPITITSFTYQLCCGLDFCHAHRIIHRDLKPQNLLVNANLQLMIADFGLARAFDVQLRKYTHEVVTLGYRAPEILLGLRLYSIPVDLWSVGCIHAEMATGTSLFADEAEIGSLFKIFMRLGTPTQAVWPGILDLPDFKTTFPKWPKRSWANIRNTLAQIGTDGVDLLSQFTCYDPTTRISARRALAHAYFANVEALTQPERPVTVTDDA